MLLILMPPKGCLSEPLDRLAVLANFQDFQHMPGESSGECGVNYPTKKARLINKERDKISDMNIAA